jgi:succinate dehydrogenase/fumarate reductase-like Fe-S protein
MFKRTAGVSCSLKESIDELEIIVCGKMFHCTIVCGKNASSVTSMIDTLGWPTLAERRLKTRLIMLYILTHALIAIPNNILIPTRV